MDNEFEVVSAMLDGEIVEIRELEIALANADGRRALIDFVRLRQAARAEQAMPRRDSAVVAAAHEGRRSVLRRRVPLPLAAAAALLAGALGLSVGFGVDRREPASAAPPAVARELRFQPGVDWQSK